MISRAVLFGVVGFALCVVFRLAVGWALILTVFSSAIGALG